MTSLTPSEDGSQIFKRLVKGADILVENFRPWVMASLGLDYEVLAELNPALIMTSISYFGQWGPYRDWDGSDIVAQAMGGLMGLTGEADREPLMLPLSQAESTSMYPFRRRWPPYWRPR
jgi:crotonobetainyl-CoA:carnitine CoA-transferase CaiB-like acyl-CoA transferase